MNKLDIDNSPLLPYMISAFLEWIWDSNEVPHLLVRTDVEGVDIPAYLKKQPVVVFNLSTEAIENYSLDAYMIRFSAKFNGSHYSISLPTFAAVGITVKGKNKSIMFDPSYYVGYPLPDQDVVIISEKGERTVRSKNNQVETEPKPKVTNNSFLKVVK